MMTKGRCAIALADSILQLDATQSGQPQIRDHAPAPGVIEGNEEALCIGEHARSEYPARPSIRDSESRIDASSSTM